MRSASSGRTRSSAGPRANHGAGGCVVDRDLVRIPFRRAVEPVFDNHRLQPALGVPGCGTVAEVGDDVRVDYRVGFDTEARHDVRFVIRQHPGPEATFLVSIRQHSGEVPAQQYPRVRPADKRAERGAVEVLGQVTVVPPESRMFNGAGKIRPGSGAHGPGARLGAAFQGKYAERRNEGRSLVVPRNVRVGGIEPDAVPRPVLVERGLQKREAAADALPGRLRQFLRGAGNPRGPPPVSRREGASGARDRTSSS